MISTSFSPGSMKTLKGDCPTQATLRMRVEAGASEDWFWQSRVGEGKAWRQPRQSTCPAILCSEQGQHHLLPKLCLEGRGRRQLPLCWPALDLWHLRAAAELPPSGAATASPVPIAPIPLTEHRVGEEEGGE